MGRTPLLNFQNIFDYEFSGNNLQGLLTRYFDNPTKSLFQRFQMALDEWHSILTNCDIRIWSNYHRSID